MLALCLTLASGAATATAAPPDGAGTGGLPSTSLWPRFSTPQTLLVADVTGLSSTDLVTATTLEGMYNGTQQPSRLYLIKGPDDETWLSRLPSGMHIERIAPAPNENLVQTLLQRLRSSIHGVIVTNPSNADTVNLATTMAGIDQGVVIDPSQEAMAAGLGIKVLYTFDTSAFSGLDPAQSYQWGVQNLLPRTSTRIEVMLPGTHPGDIRDYAVATHAFIFNLTSLDPAQKPVMATILRHSPVNTPVMGYIEHEAFDVAYLSSLGHFLNASDNLSNESVLAAMPAPATLRQPSEAAPIAARPNTVYVALVVSDGDNAQYMQHAMSQVWQQPGLGSVPEGWTIAPGTVDFAPTLLRYYTSHVPRDSELIAGPSGIGYATQMAEPDLDRFGRLSNQIMNQDDLHTVDNWEAQGYLNPFAQTSGIPSISAQFPRVEQQMGNSVVFGQTSQYLSTPQQLFCTIDQQSATVTPGKPLFLEPLDDGWNISPIDALHVAQQMALAARKQGLNMVFTTPTELALTMQRYYAGQEAGLPASNVQSMTGAQALAEPVQSPPYPTGPVRITGTNVVTNPSGASGTTGWTHSAGTLGATTYEGRPALHWTNDVTNAWSDVTYYPAVSDGQTYTFTAEVAGSGQAHLNVYNGSTDTNTLPVKLTSTYHKFTWTATIPNNAPTGQTGNAPQLQIRDSGAGPVSMYIKDASVTASTSPC